MTQVTSGIRSLLSIPAIYNLLQIAIGTRASKTRLVRDHIRVKPGHRILDVGCGTGLLLEALPESIEYIGLDGSSEYIEHATLRHGARGKFINQHLDDTTVTSYTDQDRVTAIGVLHHLEDNQVLQLFRIAKHALKPDTGEFHSIDPCFVPHQSSISKMIVKRDRGQNVRSPDEYAALARQVFSSVDVVHRNDMLRIPYDHAILRCS